MRKQRIEVFDSKGQSLLCSKPLSSSFDVLSQIVKEKFDNRRLIKIDPTFNHNTSDSTWNGKCYYEFYHDNRLIAVSKEFNSPQKAWRYLQKLYNSSLKMILDHEQSSKTVDKLTV